MEKKIKMSVPIVEMDGDEMTRIIWKLIKDILLKPYIDLKTEYYDLGLKNRDKTEDKVTHDASNAVIKYGVGVKCATITPNAERVKEYNLKKMWKSPNGTIRAELDGTVFRKPIILKSIKPFVRTWTKPIVIARHAYGDIYKAKEYKIEGPGTAELYFTYKNGKVVKNKINEFDGAGVVSGMYNTDDSIKNFARSCFQYAVDEKMDLWFSSKDTISKIYDQRFKDIFYEMYKNEFKEKFESLNIKYYYNLIDSTLAKMVRSNGGMVLALKNYDGDIISDLVASAFGSIAMMTSVLVSPDGKYEYEAAHGTVQDQYYDYLKGKETSTNSVATIFAWTGALRKRGQIDKNRELVDFSYKLEKASIDTIEKGLMTKDLIGLSDLKCKKALNTEDFLYTVKNTLEDNI